MSVSKIDILNHSFSRSLRGYNTVQVEAFLQDVADTIGRLTEEKTSLANQVAVLESQLAEHRDRESTLRDTLITTQKLTDSLKATVQEESKRILDSAQDEAQRRIDLAQKEAQRIIDSAHTRAESLEQQRNSRLAQLDEGIAELRKQKVHFEMRIRAVIEQHLKLLDMESEMDSDPQERVEHENVTAVE
ncbi:MAG: DivIVA domain-containing protein [Desulfovibrionaceae bacterium]|nr:DivIVA domain-containing protein [Desulfovibrionaceae bacterium]